MLFDILMNGQFFLFLLVNLILRLTIENTITTLALFYHVNVSFSGITGRARLERERQIGTVNRSRNPPPD
jgi:hypothetical protein